MGTQEKTMKLDPKTVEAASDLIRTPRGATMLTAAERARRVLKAASENVPWEVSLKVAQELEAAGVIIGMTDVAKILSAGLAKWAEEE
jgi:hypothetical protein